MKIEVKNLVKEYTQGDEIIKAVDNVSFLIEKGGFISITGRSGSGKSTLMNIMAGLTKPTSGSVLFNGNDISKFNDKEISLYRNNDVGCLPQVSSVLSALTVLDNVRLPYHLAKREGDSEEDAYKLLEMVGLKKYAKRMPSRLSGGQLKRVAIARSMINKPAFLLADEPTSDLDIKTTEEIMGIFRKAADAGTGVMVITHDVETMEYMDKCYEMTSGVLSRVK